MPTPIYTPDNCHSPAYQLDWSYTIFWRASPLDTSSLGALQQLNAPDHIRILEHEFRRHHVSQFLISTRLSVAPLRIAQRVKGRLQRLVRRIMRSTE
jgi:hypothetical protein